MSAVFDAVTSAFDEAGWSYGRVPDLEVVEAEFEAHHTRVPLHVQAFEKINAVTVVARAGASVAPDHRLPVCELLMRANRELTVGNFELDWEAGVVVFRATNLFPQGAADPSIVTGLVHSAIVETDRLTPCLTIVLRTAPEACAALDLAGLLEREDLIPPPPEEDGLSS